MLLLCCVGALWLLSTHRARVRRRRGSQPLPVTTMGFALVATALFVALGGDWALTAAEMATVTPVWLAVFALALVPVAREKVVLVAAARRPAWQARTDIDTPRTTWEHVQRAWAASQRTGPEAGQCPRSARRR